MRAFIAFDFDLNIKSEITNIQKNFKNIAKGNIKYVSSEQFHLTSFFLDEISEQRAEKIINELKNLKIEKIPPLVFEKLDYFPSKKNPRVIVLRSESNEILEKLVLDIDKSLNKLGFQRDKKFKPHITLGRVRDDFEYVEFKFTPLGANLESLTLYKSTLTRDGAIYDSLYKTNLS